MLCDNCRQNQASIHTVTIINGEKQEHYLCADCATGAQYSLPSLMDILSGFHTLSQQAPACTCECGTTLEKFQKTGLLGCPKCYTTFQGYLIPVIKRAQGGKLRHVGRRPQVAAAAEETRPIIAPPQPVDERERLREELKLAVAEEHYERAAELRDRLRALEGGECR